VRHLGSLLALTIVAIGPPATAGWREYDWANLARYQEANRALAARPDPRRVVFIGDSITEVWADWPIFRANPHFVGRGISGQTALQMLERFRSDVIQLKPAVVHILAGTNDIAQNMGPETEEQALRYIAGMTELAQANGIEVVIGSVPPTADFPWRQGLEPAAKIRRFNARLAAYAASRGATYADYWSPMAASDGSMQPQYSRDGLHPNVAGFQAMQPVAAAALEKAMARP
jgi:lysophospholipase L1-like esterase